MVDERDVETEELQVSSPQKILLWSYTGCSRMDRKLKLERWKDSVFYFSQAKTSLEKALDELKLEDFHLKPVYVLAPHIQGQFFPRMSCPDRNNGCKRSENLTLLSEGPKACLIRTILLTFLFFLLISKFLPLTIDITNDRIVSSNITLDQTFIVTLSSLFSMNCRLSYLTLSSSHSKNSHPMTSYLN